LSPQIDRQTPLLLLYIRFINILNFLYCKLA
jgi:hypothetical protein